MESELPSIPDYERVSVMLPTSFLGRVMTDDEKALMAALLSVEGEHFLIALTRFSRAGAGSDQAAA